MSRFYDIVAWYKSQQNKRSQIAPYVRLTVLFTS